MKQVRDILIIAVILILIQVGLSNLFNLVTVPNKLMNPEFEQDQKVLFLKSPTTFTTLERGLIVLYKPKSGDGTLIGRIIALPTESFRVENNGIYINNGKLFRLNEDYVPRENTLNVLDKEYWFNLGTDEYLILVDNRSFQITLADNIVKKSNIEGLLLFRL